MSNRKLAKTIQNLSREVQRLYRNFNRGIVNWLLRSAFVAHRRGQSPVAGFVLPVVTLLLLVVTLTVGAMTLRAFDRNVQVIAESQQKVIYNAATPAIDRARSKLEFLFDSTKEIRYPGGVPLESQLLTLMTNAATATSTPLAAGTSVDAYTLPGEARVNVGEANGTAVDNVWRYRADTDGDGQNDSTVLYSIIFRTPTPVSGGASAATQLLSLSDAEKATQGIVRGGPISNQSNLTSCGGGSSGGDVVTNEAWFEDKSNSSRIRKNFQVDAIVIPDKAKGAAVTLEFQQDRQIQRGNKWGAWFRSDLEIFPGSAFNWNGAMHTEGSLMIGQSQPGSTFEAYLISSPQSCFYQKESSEISATNIPENTESATNTIPKFVGHAAFGMIGGTTLNSVAPKVYIHKDNAIPDDPKEMTATTVSSTAALSAIASNPSSIVLTENSRSVSNGTNEPSSRWPTFATEKIAPNPGGLGERIINKSAEVPYVDDLYRADDRYGPKAKYKDPIPALINIGTPIPTGNALIKNDGDSIGVGLDGYWERRARTEGLRVLVGERLELGNIGGWQTPKDLNGDGYINTGRPATFLPTAPVPITANIDLDGDPLYPITVKPYPVSDASVRVPHLTQQRRSLRDNLPAVQSAVVYHSAVGNDKDYPVACLAMTIHPGTVDTLRQSTNFMPTKFASGATGAATAPEYLLSDFFTGRGTDGWEFSTPGGSATTIATALGANQPLRIALENLANFAGDPDGAFPPKQDDVIHPYPALSMWGNFSNLRRTLKSMADGTSYADLSPADKTYLHTAACSLGMLAYEVDQVQKFDPTNGANNSVWNNSGSKRVLTDLSDRLATLIDGDVTNGEVLSKGELKTYGYTTLAADAVDSTSPTNVYNARDYDNVPPEAYIAGLKQQDVLKQIDYLNDPVIRMAEMIMLSNQIRRDRTFGFRPSPAFGEYAVVKDSAIHFFPTACDPDLFDINGNDITKSTYPIAGANAIIPDSARQLSTLATGALKPFSPPYATAEALPGAVGDALNKLSGRRLALSRLCGGLRVPTGYDPKAKPAVATATGAFNPAARPVVMPKFPSLYYIFPEVEHGLQGATATTWDHRQPGAIDTTVPPAFTVAPRPVALDPAQIAVLTAGEAASIVATETAKAGLDPYDREPYIVDPYVTTALGTNTFKPVTATVARAAYPTPTPLTNTLNPEANRAALTSTSQFLARFPYAGTSPLPTADLSLGTVGSLVLAPREIGGFPAGAPASVLPGFAPTEPVPREIGSYTPPNLIQIPRTATATNGIQNLSQGNMPTKPWAVPFLDRAIFDGRQLQVARVTDIDLGMLRSNKPGNQVVPSAEYGTDDTWLPMSGVVYAFREDAVREDAIARKVGGTVTAALPENPSTAQLATLHNTLKDGTATNVTDPANPYDPIQESKKISIKAIDYVPDPDRRVHGFRLRNGAQLKRNDSVVTTGLVTKNTRGLSLFTDQPVYVQGDFNLHQDGADNTDGALLEEFDQQLFSGDNPPAYTKATFYQNRTGRNGNFAKSEPGKDRWRPSEILADAVSILSTQQCDGSIADTFTKTTETTKNQVPTYSVDADNVPVLIDGSFRQSLYIDPGNSGGLYLYGCSNGSNVSSFGNQNRVKIAPQRGWDWKREGASFITPPPVSIPANATQNRNLPTWGDFTTPVQIGRLGEPLLEARSIGGSGSRPLPFLPVNYSLGGFGSTNTYVQPGDASTDTSVNNGFSGRLLIPVATSDKKSTRMNGIMVGGIPPSRENQSYGGLHNFPRFLEMWRNANFIYSGSFVQLNFSNYATGPFEQEAWEPGDAVSTAQQDRQFYPPNRRWGYDVGLQIAPAGPAAARFVTPLATRSEFYTEPPVTDPYIKRLCTAARGVVPAGTTVNCPA
jgi:hypothetical protein